MCAYENTWTHYNKGRFIMCIDHVITKAIQCVGKYYPQSQANETHKWRCEIWISRIVEHVCDLLLYWIISAYLFIKWLHSSESLFTSVIVVVVVVAIGFIVENLDYFDIYKSYITAFFLIGKKEEKLILCGLTHEIFK